MEWDEVVSAKPEVLEGDKALLDDVFTFLSRNTLPESIDEGEGRTHVSGQLSSIAS